MLLSTKAKTRVRNLRELQGRLEAYGARTEKHFAEYLAQNGASITFQQLSLIYQEKKEVGLQMASSIEQAMSLPSGWLSEDHEFLFSLSAQDLDAHRALASLAPELRENISAILLRLARGK